MLPSLLLMLPQFLPRLLVHPLHNPNFLNMIRSHSSKDPSRAPHHLQEEPKLHGGTSQGLLPWLMSPDSQLFTKNSSSCRNPSPLPTLLHHPCQTTPAHLPVGSSLSTSLTLPHLRFISDASSSKDPSSSAWSLPVSLQIFRWVIGPFVCLFLPLTSRFPDGRAVS